MKQICKAHGGFFIDIKPASGGAEAKALIDPNMPAETEATAVVRDE